MKSWSSSYSYSSDGHRDSYQYENDYIDNDRQYKTGLQSNRNLDKKTKSENFYHSKSDKHNKCSVLGKSNNNSNWSIEKRNNNKRKSDTEQYEQYEQYFNSNGKRLKSQPIDIPTISNSKNQLLNANYINANYINANYINANYINENVDFNMENYLDNSTFLDKHMRNDVLFNDNFFKTN